MKEIEKIDTSKSVLTAPGFGNSNKQSNPNNNSLIKNMGGKCLTQAGAWSNHIHQNHLKGQCNQHAKGLKQRFPTVPCLPWSRFKDNVAKDSTWSKGGFLQPSRQQADGIRLPGCRIFQRKTYIGVLDHSRVIGSDGCIGSSVEEGKANLSQDTAASGVNRKKSSFMQFCNGYKTHFH